MPEAMPFYEPGGRLTGHCSAAVVGKRFLKITGNRQSARGVTDATGGGNYLVAQALNGEDSVGVSGYDAAAGTKTAILADPGMIVPVEAGAAIVAGQRVQSDALGRAIPVAGVAPNVALGKAMTGTAIGVDAEIKLLG